MRTRFQFSPQWFLLLIPVILLSLFAYRWIFFAQFEYEYYRNWYDHSQWQIALSPRIMGDAELYQLSGYALTQGDSPFHINPEVPPLGKYFYGFSILWTQNPYYASLFFYFGVVGLFGVLSWLLFPKLKERWIALTLFVLQPLIFSQIGQVGLDLPQLFFLLLHVTFLLLTTRTTKASHQIGFALLSGISLGGFTAIKIGAYTPVIWLAAAWLLWRQRKLIALGVLSVATPLVYMATYTHYFTQGNSLIEWLKAQKWMYNFYKSSKVEFIYGMVLFTALTGFFTVWWGNIVYAWEWTIVWAIGLIVLLVQLLSKKFWQDKKIPIEWKYVTLLTTGIIALTCLVPFWSRYFLLIVPFFILLLTKVLSQKKLSLLYIVIGISLLQFVFFLFPRPNDVLDLAQDTWQRGSYAELYNFTDSAAQQAVPRKQFVRNFQLLDQQFEVNKRIVDMPTVWTWPWQNQVTVPVNVTYKTVVGDVNRPMQISLIRQNNQWRIQWHWSDFIPQFQPELGDIFEFRRAQVRPGNLYTKDGFPLSTAEKWPFIIVKTSEVTDIEVLVDDLTRLMGHRGEDVRHQLLVLSPADLPIPIGFPVPHHDPMTLRRIKTYPGVTIEDRVTRVYHPYLLHSESVIEKVKSLQDQNPQVKETPGGELVIKKPNGETQTALQFPAKDGERVELSQTAQELFGDSIPQISPP